jgi:hypothetical protein
MEFPLQVAVYDRDNITPARGKFDMRDKLFPNRLTMAMWDQAFLLRHHKGGSFENYDKALSETVERGYNTVRLDPMPHLVDLDKPDQIITWPDPKMPYMPWGWNCGVEAPVGKWTIEFMEKLFKHDLNYTLSCWWFSDPKIGPLPKRIPVNHVEAAEIWIEFLRKWQKRFGFDRLIYLDIANEVPWFTPNYINYLKEKVNLDWMKAKSFNAEQREFLANDLNAALIMLRQEFPQLIYTASIHGDLRWLDVPVEFDCLDVHFYADADPRWIYRTKFFDLIKDWKIWNDTSGYKDFSDRCMTAIKTAGPMFRQRQRQKLSAFSDWSQLRGMPLTTTESWASWFYVDHPDLDWKWLLDWAAWTVEDAIEYKMWGWTPHNYVQPQFNNWKDAQWHRKLNDKFLNS